MSSSAARPTSSTTTHAAQGFGITDLLLLLMAALWGGNFFAVQYGTAHMPGLAFNTTRMLLAAIVMAAVAVATARAPWPCRADCLRLMAYGLLGHGLYQYLFVSGLSRSRGGSASLIMAASPAALALLAWLTSAERMTRWLIGGVALSIGGVAMVMLGDNVVSHTGGSWTGSLFLVAAVLAWAGYITLLKPLTDRLHGLHVTLITLVGGLLPLMVLTSPDLLATPWTNLEWRTWMALAYSGLGAMVAAYLIYNHGVRTIGATRTSLYSNLQPFVAILVAWQFQQDVPTIWQGLGFFCITGGLLLARKAA
jgi:drug/metabolite transporter (DMT)-like permease